MGQSDFCYFFGLSPVSPLNFPTVSGRVWRSAESHPLSCPENSRSPRYAVIPNVCSPCSQTPADQVYSRLTNKPYSLRLITEYRLPLNKLTRLNHFTLARYGSHTPLPTLKPNLAASAPRLCTGCLLGFTRSAYIRLFPLHRTGARKCVFFSRK